ncbi:uncharacterized protein SOCE836_028460 [Sorangium cellulosum]|uniref:Uncharacterized protein n=1 Tax=Sorangium cellulosum TaxID=56 RepID=A0A4P2QLB5_SORCE|nr:uncharacterized protein SOCE836_028460 [Sorangium cellulosum]WCQ90117.1 hypothetical protein NQZ70_02818 [Sorangium sp. Soce836]
MPPEPAPPAPPLVALDAELPGESPPPAAVPLPLVVPELVVLAVPPVVVPGESASSLHAATSSTTHARTAEEENFSRCTSMCYA